MTITPRIGVSAIEFIRSKDGSEEKLVEHVSEELVRWIMEFGAECAGQPYTYDSETVLKLLREEEKHARP